MPNKGLLNKNNLQNVHLQLIRTLNFRQIQNSLK